MQDRLQAAVDELKRDRDRKAGQALDAIDRLQADLAAVKAEIAKAKDGGAARPDLFTPSHQRMAEVVKFGAEFGALWSAVGTAVMAQEIDL